MHICNWKTLLIATYKWYKSTIFTFKIAFIKIYILALAWHTYIYFLIILLIFINQKKTVFYEIWDFAGMHNYHSIISRSHYSRVNYIKNNIFYLNLYYVIKPNPIYMQQFWRHLCKNSVVIWPMTHTATLHNA